MPKIRDLGISVIPVTMRPTEIGGGAADVKYWAGGDCIPTDGCAAPTYGDCHPTDQCAPPSHQECDPTDPRDCQATPDDQCCPTDLPGSTKDTKATMLPDGAIAQLRQQLQQQIGEDLRN